MSDEKLIDQTMKARFTDWLLAQGVSTILLCAILAFLGYMVVVMVPQHLNMIQEGFQKNAQELSRSLEMVVQSHEKDREMFLRMIDGRQVVRNP